MKRMILGVFVVAASAIAQQATQQIFTQQVIELQDKQQMEAAGALPGPAPMIARFGGTASAVKGAPYSAEATTESVQLLADGNRIVNKSSNKSYRDSEGRTRTEITPGATGAWMPDMKPFSITVIDDPVSGDHITLNNNNKQATRFSVKTTTTTTTGAAGGTAKSQTVTMVMRSSGDSAMPMPMPMPLPVPTHVAGGHANATYVQSGAGTNVHVNAFLSADAKIDVKKESLGKQVIEGVECTGTKETSTIAAGSVGNDRAIETVTERWYSPDLQLDVMTKTTDPRFGETTYRLGNIIRAEQPKSLFEVPSDYKLEEPDVHYKVMKSDVKQ
jgi:hypothetical protein